VTAVASRLEFSRALSEAYRSFWQYFYDHSTLIIPQGKINRLLAIEDNEIAAFNRIMEETSAIATRQYYPNVNGPNAQVQMTRSQVMATGSLNVHITDLLRSLIEESRIRLELELEQLECYHDSVEEEEAAKSDIWEIRGVASQQIEMYSWSAVIDLIERVQQRNKERLATIEMHYRLGEVMQTPL
jgi:hypothetical protein